MRRRPSNVDHFLTAHPECRQKIEAAGRDIGTPVLQLVEQLRKLGASVSKSGVARWRQRVINAGSARLQAIRLVLEATDEEIDGVILMLASNRQKIVANPWPMAAPKQPARKRRKRS